MISLSFLSLLGLVHVMKAPAFSADSAPGCVVTSAAVQCHIPRSPRWPVVLLQPGAWGGGSVARVGVTSLVLVSPSGAGIDVLGCHWQYHLFPCQKPPSGVLMSTFSCSSLSVASYFRTVAFAAACCCLPNAVALPSPTIAHSSPQAPVAGAHLSCA